MDDLAAPSLHGSTVVSFSLNDSMLSGVSQRVRAALAAGSGASAPRAGSNVFLNVNATSGSLRLTPLMRAARDGNMGHVRILLRAGADPTQVDDREYDALMYAVRDGHHAVCEVLLLALKRRVARAGLRGYTFQNRHRLSHMLYAALSGHAGCVTVLARFGSRVDVGDNNGFTPLMAAASNNHPDVATLLLSLGAQVDLCDRRGLSALSWAVRSGTAKCVRVLLSHGAAATQTDQTGRSPLLFAVLGGYSEIGELLLDAGATVCDKVRLAVLRAHVLRQQQQHQHRQLLLLQQQQPPQQQHAGAGAGAVVSGAPSAGAAAGLGGCDAELVLGQAIETAIDEPLGESIGESIESVEAKDAAYF